MRRLRVYADTSVFGGCFDDEFAEASRTFFRDVAAGRFVVVIADAVLRELALAPEQVRGILKDLPAGAVERITLTEEIGRLLVMPISARGCLGAPAGMTRSTSLRLRWRWWIC